MPMQKWIPEYGQYEMHNMFCDMLSDIHDTQDEHDKDYGDCFERPDQQMDSSVLSAAVEELILIAEPGTNFPNKSNLVNPPFELDFHTNSPFELEHTEIRVRLKGTQYFCPAAGQIEFHFSDGSARTRNQELRRTGILEIDGWMLITNEQGLFLQRCDDQGKVVVRTLLEEPGNGFLESATLDEAETFKEVAQHIVFFRHISARDL